MFSSLLTVAVMTAAIGPQAQAQPQGQWLGSLPADMPIVLRVSGVEQATDDFVAMVRAMSPDTADAFGPQVKAAVSELTKSIGMGDQRSPALILLQPPKVETIVREVQDAQRQVEQGGLPKSDYEPRAVLVFATEDYKKALATLTDRRSVEPQAQQGGYDKVETDEGKTVFAIQKRGFAAITAHEDLIKEIAAGPRQSLAETIPATLRSILNEGDLGLYVDLAAIRARYGDQVELFENALMSQLEGLKEGGFDLGESTRLVAVELFEAARQARGVAAHADFTEAGLKTAGKVLMDPDYEATRKLADLGAGTDVELAKLPKDAAYYSFGIVDPENTGAALFGQEVPQAERRKLASYLGLDKVVASEAFDRAEEQYKKAGRAEAVASFSIVESGTRGLCVISAEDPKALIDGTRELVAAFKGQDVPFLKELNHQQDAQKYKGYTFDRVDVTVDYQALIGQVEKAANRLGSQVSDEVEQGDVEFDDDDVRQIAEGIRTVLGQKLTTWIGTDGETVINVAAADWNEAQGRLDAYFKGDQGIGTTASYKKVRGQLPERASQYNFVNAPAALKQLAGRAREVSGAQDVKVPEGMPAEPVLIGNAVVFEQDGVRWASFLPSEVGPVIEEGLVPMVMEVLRNREVEIDVNIKKRDN